MLPYDPASSPPAASCGAPGPAPAPGNVTLAGVSQRTLFRYFGTKEDHIGGAEEQFDILLTQTIREQPADAGAWEALRAALKAALSLHESPEQALERFRLVPPHRLAARHLPRQARALPGGATATARKQTGALRDGQDKGQVRAIVATAFACFDAATATWLETNGQGDILDLYDQGLAAVRG